jgi:Pvc16 N-terminal domain
MSNSLAIAAVTAALRARVFSRLGGSQVTVAPPDRAPDAVNGDHVNLFLYRADVHPTFRNADPPGSPPGESPKPLLPLVLHYLLASYSADEGAAHELLGAAMLALHESPILSGDEIRAGTATPLADSDLHLQLDHVKISFESLSQDDIAKMWTAFATPFRMSASYQVSVVLIDSPVPGRAPLPVLRRGANDRSPTALPDADPPFPAVTGVSYAAPGQPAALPGENVTLAVGNLPAANLTAHLRHLRVPVTADVPLPAPPAGATQVVVTLPAAPLPAGPWALSLAPAAGGASTNDVPVAAAPATTAVTATPAGGTPARTRITVTAAQPVLVGQQAAVLVGSQQVAVPLLTADTATLAVTAVIPSGTHKVRLRVDGVDSDIVDYATGGFRTGAAVEVTVP